MQAMTLAFRPPPCPDSPLRRLDSRWKLAGLLLLVVATAAVTGLAASAAGLGVAVLLAGLGRLPPGWALGRLAAVVLVLGLFVAPLPFVAADGLWTAGVVSCKVLAVALLGLVVLATAPPDDTLKAAQALRVP